MKRRERRVTRVDLARSKALSRRVGAANGACFENAYKVLLHVRGGFWVEGYVVTTFGTPVRHAWVETARGTILEITPVHQPLVNRYFPARRFTLKEISNRTASIGQFHWDAAMKAAYRRALAAAGLPWPFPSGGVIRVVGEELVWFRSAAAARRVLRHTKRREPAAGRRDHSQGGQHEEAKTADLLAGARRRPAGLRRLPRVRRRRRGP